MSVQKMNILLVLCSYVVYSFFAVFSLVTVQMPTYRITQVVKTDEVFRRHRIAM